MVLVVVMPMLLMLKVMMWLKHEMIRTEDGLCDVAARMSFLLSCCHPPYQVAGLSVIMSTTRCWKTGRRRTSRKMNARQHGKNTSVRNSAFTSAHSIHPGISHIPPITRCSHCWCQGLQLVLRSTFDVWSRTYHSHRELYQRDSGFLRSRSLVNVQCHHFWVMTNCNWPVSDVQKYCFDGCLVMGWQLVISLLSWDLCFVKIH